MWCSKLYKSNKRVEWKVGEGKYIDLFMLDWCQIDFEFVLLSRGCQTGGAFHTEENNECWEV